MTIDPPSPLPEVPKAELGLLCSFLHSPDTVAGLVAQKKAIPEFFHHPDNRTLFETLLRMHKEGVPIDMISVGLYIAKHKIHLETLTPEAYIAEIWCFIETASMALFYLETLRESFARRSAILECQRIERELREDAVTTQDVYDLTTSAFKEVQEICIIEEPEDDVDKQEAMRFLDDMQKAAMGQKNPALMPFGLPTIDDMTGGGMRGELVVITGLPGVGKSLTGQKLVTQSVFQRNENAHVYSMEMGHQQCLRRYVADLGNISLRSMRKGIFTEREFNGFAGALSKVTSSGLKIYDIKRNKMTPQSIEAEIRKGKKNRGLDVVMADYLQLIRTNSQSEKRRDQELQEISKRFKLLAGELDIMFILLAQANEAGGCFDSSQVEADADWVLNLNPVFKTEGKIRRITGTDSIYLSKAREGERGKRIPLRMLGEYARIEECQEVVKATDF